MPILSISVLGISRGLLGIAVLIGIAWLFSANRKAINWRLVGMGLIIQIVIAISVLEVGFIANAFDWVSRAFVKTISFADVGAEFVIGKWPGAIDVTNSFTKEVGTTGFLFAFKVLPTILFFSALSALFYYFGILQKVVFGLAWVMKKTMRLSGAESLSAAGNIFLGQTEAPLLIRPYLDKMTKSEIMTLMTGGMATIAGGVLASYIGFLGGEDSEAQIEFAKHLLTASVMSAPAAVIAAKMLVPETEQVNTSMKISKDKIGSNALEAIANGTTDGLKLAINVGAMLLVFTALIAFLNYIFLKTGAWTGINEAIRQNTPYDGFSMQMVIGYLFSPIAWLMGVNSSDMVLVGQLLGEKTILNEFFAYTSLGDMREKGLFASHKSEIIATYILCGFANFASIGIQIGGIGALVPNRKGLLSKLGLRALVGGTLACLFTAAIVGMLM